MRKKDKDAFLRSITGTKPIQKKDNIKKSYLKSESLNIENIKTRKIVIKNLVEPKIITTEKKENSKNKIETTRINKKLKKGKIPPDRKIDFHGMSLIEAEELLCNTVINCYNTNKRCILFVTGKGVNKKETDFSDETRLYYGKIRGAFSSWIRKPEIEKYILGIEQASMEFGADGAFFVYLRKKPRGY
tara:strand:- start:1144 stop:1707 length:564 start_codon:yes stop_codon:yes gene_type:complete